MNPPIRIKESDLIELITKKLKEEGILSDMNNSSDTEIEIPLLEKEINFLLDIIANVNGDDESEKSMINNITNKLNDYLIKR